jgi:hypothetical protein
MVMLLVLLSAAQAQVRYNQENTFTVDQTGLPHVLEYPLPPNQWFWNSTRVNVISALGRDGRNDPTVEFLVCLKPTLMS